MRRYMIEDSEGWYSRELLRDAETAAQTIEVVYRPDETLDYGMTATIREISIDDSDGEDTITTLAAVQRVEDGYRVWTKKTEKWTWIESYGDAIAAMWQQ